MKETGSKIRSMAEAMLEEDYRSSHGNISEWCEDEMQDNMKQSQEEGHPRQVEEPSQEKGKGSEKRVAIQLPPKRRKISTSHAPKDVVEGEPQFAEHATLTTSRDEKTKV